MYAIIHTGGKQAKVSPGDVIDVERLKGAGDEVVFTPILVVNAEGEAITDPAALGGSTVTAKVLGENRGDKIHIFKYKNKTGYRRRIGHRQTYTRLEVTDIELAKAAKQAKPAAKADSSTEEE